MYDILVIGSGPAGLTAAIYGSRANKKVGILTGLNPGGQLTQTTHIENFPGFANPIMGPKLMEEMQQQARNVNAEFIEDALIELTNKSHSFEVKTYSGLINTKSIIIATGANAKWLGIESDFIGRGVSSCATCDGSFFKEKEVAVIGGGNSAFEEAIYLSDIAKTVYLIHRRNEFRAEKIMQERLFKKKNIKLLTPYKAINFYGNIDLEGIKILNTETNKEEDMKLDGVFIAIGHTPNTSFLKEILKLDEEGYITENITTSVPGLFVAGDVADKKYRQAITAAGFGCMAALEAIKFIED